MQFTNARGFADRTTTVATKSRSGLLKDPRCASFTGVTWHLCEGPEGGIASDYFNDRSHVRATLETMLRVLVPATQYPTTQPLL